MTHITVCDNLRKTGNMDIYVYFKKTTQWAFLLLFCATTAISCRKDVLYPVQVTQLMHDVRGDINKILFINDSVGYVIGGNRYSWHDILSSTDGGKNWLLYHEENEGHKSVYGISHYKGRIYMVGYDGKIFIKPSVEQSWQYIQTPGWEWLQDVVFTGSDTGYIVAGIGYGHGRIFMVDSLCQIVKTDTFEYELSAIAFPVPSIGYAAGYGAILKTENSGQSWQLLNVKGDFFKSIYCVDADRVWAVGFNGSIMYSGDGGRHWQQKRNGDNPLLKPYKFRTVLFKDENTGYIAGDKGVLLKTSDAGVHWSEMKQFTKNDLRCLAFHPDGSLWVGGSEGALFRIVD